MAAIRAHPSRLEREREERNFECQEAEEGDPEDVVACQPKQMAHAVRVRSLMPRIKR
jgi:hypothetical protein